MATKEQIRKIYALGGELGIKGNGHDDLLHELICGITGKDSVRELNDSEVRAVLSEMYKRKPAAANSRKKTEKEPGDNGMATKEQQALCWRYCYRLKELDPDPESADVYDRLAGAIRKICDTNIIPKTDPFRCVDQKSCSMLIEQLKRYVNTAERRAKRQGDMSG